jgi:hypothetical protein
MRAESADLVIGLPTAGIAFVTLDAITTRT